MKKLFVLGFIMNLFVIGYSQTSNVASGPSCSCPAGWGSCSANCFLTDCCICFNPQTSEGGCACYWGFSSCRTAPTGTAKSTDYTTSTDAKVSFSFERFDELLKYLSSQKIDVSGLSKNCQPIQSRYIGQKGKVSVSNTDFNTLFNAYKAFIENLRADEKVLVKNYIDLKEKTN